MTAPRIPQEADVTLTGVVRARRPISGVTAVTYLAGDVLAGRYEVRSIVGRGGMGVVYRAYDRKLDEHVAVKVLRRDLGFGPDMIERFSREVKIARRISHPNVARVFDLAEDGDERMLTMELVEGMSLAELLAKSGPLPEARALEIAGHIAAGLGAAHAAGVIHRDLKPDNVMIAPEGRVALMDFGVARLAREAIGAGSAGLTIGTPAYMAPEQVEGDDLDARADFYALGAVLFEMLTGHQAWEGETAFAIAAARLFANPPDPRQRVPEVSEAAAAVVMRLLARRSVDRFESAGEVIAALSSAAGAPAACSDARPSRISMVPASSGAPSSSISVFPPSSAAPRSRESAAPSIAVLPFRNLGDPSVDYLAEEIAFELADSLCATRRLRVRPMSAVTSKLREEVDPVALGHALEVDFIVEGSVRRTGDSVRAHVRLIDTADGFQRWARREHRPLAEAFALIDDLVQAITAELRVSGALVARSTPMDPAAIVLLIQGRLESRRIWAEHQTRALELLGEAERLAPDDPFVAAAQAIALIRRASVGGAPAPEARARAERAVELGPTLGEAHLALGMVMLQQGREVEGVHELSFALRCQPSLADAHAMLGRALFEAGATERGAASLAHALALDPDHPIAIATLARLRALGGDIPRGLRMLDDAIGRTQQSYFTGPRARLVMWSRDVGRASALLAEAEGRQEVSWITQDVLRVAARKELWPASLAKAPPDGDARARAFLLQIIAEARIIAQDAAAALRAVQQSAEAGLSDLAWLDGCPLLVELRAEAGFRGAREVVAARAARVVAAYEAPAPARV